MPPRPRPAEDNPPGKGPIPEPLRSSVTIWVAGRSRRYSVRAVAGSDQDVARLTGVALAAEARIRGTKDEPEGAGDDR
jgi:hypothetical protein